MSRFVVLKLNGDLHQQGFHVTMEVAQEGHYPALSEEGTLPPSPELAQSLTQWRATYTRLACPSRGLTPYKIQYDGPIHPLHACTESANCLVAAFRQWLRSGSFLDIEMQLRRVLAPHDVIRVVIRSPNQQIQALPWHLWPFVDDYPQAEIAMGSCRFQRAVEEWPWKASMTPKVTILAVLGDRQNIDIESDRRLLNALPGAQVNLLVEPTPQALHEQLYQASWDILFFAGHSDTDGDGQGSIRLNPTTTLTIEELKYGLRQAIANGLQLAVFNSCNGLGLAHALADLQLPQMIVMREAIPDHVAHSFLKYFLQAFSQGRSLYQSVRQAREQLAGMEKTYPCASWLPVIYQHPGRTPPSWQGLQQIPGASEPVPASPHSSIQTRPSQNPRLRSPRRYRPSISQLMVNSFVITSLVMGVRFLGALQPLEFWAFDSLLRSRPTEAADERLLLITIDEDDLDYQDEQGYDRVGSLSNHALAEILQKLQPHRPAVVGIDIFRDRPLVIKPRPIKTVQVLQKNESAAEAEDDSDLVASANAIFICQVQMGETLATISPPPNIDPSRVGFSNVIADPGQRLRRHLLGMSPDADGDCSTDKSFSYRVATTYLGRESNVQVTLRRNMLTINGAEFVRLTPHSGAYHTIDMGGHTTLLNYRATDAIAPTIALSDLIEGSWDQRLANLVSDRIVLIGTIARSFKDYHQTPYGEMAGVEIQAHMISQILSAVEDDRPLLRPLPQWGDTLWVFAWTAGTGAVLLLLPSRRALVVVAIATLAGLGMLCFQALRIGWWLPLIPTAIGCTMMAASTGYANLFASRPD